MHFCALLVWLVLEEARALDPLQLKLQTDVNHHVGAENQGLRIKHGSSGKAVSILNH